MMSYSYNLPKDLSTSAREEWTSAPDTAARHVIQNFSKDQRSSIMYTWGIMSNGGGGDAIEPWGPSIRSVIYPHWSDADFVEAIRLVQDDII